MAFPDMWDEVFLMSVELAGGTEIQMAAIVDPTSLEFPPGDYPSESKPNAAGGRLWSQNPEEDGEINFDIWGIELDTTSGVGLFQQFIGGAQDASEPLTSDIAFPAGVARTRELYRIAILFTNDPAATTAAGATAASTDSFRFYAEDCRFIGLKPSFSDGQLKQTAQFKFKPFNKAGTAKNYAFQSGDQTALVALSNY